MKKRLFLILAVIMLLSMTVYQPSNARQNDIDQTLIMNVTVINDHGGLADPDTFDLKLSLQDPSQGRYAPIKTQTIQGDNEILETWEERPEPASYRKDIGVGAYSVRMSGSPDLVKQYTYTYSDGCKGFMQAQPITCDIVANDKPVKLTIRKVVAGTTSYIPEDFTMNLIRPDLKNGDIVTESYTGSASGVIVELPARPYIVYETAEYTWGLEVSSSAGCQAHPEIGDEITCIITNRALDDFYFKVIGFQETCGAPEIDWTPAFTHFVVPETPGTDIRVQADYSSNDIVFGSEDWAFEYGDIRFQRVGNERFGIRIIGLTTGEGVMRFPNSGYKEWRATPLSTDFILGRHDAFTNDKCIGRFYFAILLNSPSPLAISLAMTELERVELDAPREDTSRSLEDMVLIIATAQRNLYTGFPIDLRNSVNFTELGIYQGLFTIDPTSEEWASRIAWIEGKTQPNQADDDLAEDVVEIPADSE